MRVENKVPLIYPRKMTQNSGREYTLYIDILDVYLLAVFCLSILSLPAFKYFNVMLVFLSLFFLSFFLCSVIRFSK